MKRSAFVKASLASLMVATTMVGCTGAAFHPRAAAVPQQQDAVRLAASAEKALASRDGARAVIAAEGAVRAEPRNARYRLLLGRAYVASGRFASAETALTDAMTLGNSDARTIVSLALVQVALGKPDAARNLLSINADNVPASDYGLAMAMAGDAPEGVRILSEVIHDPSANAQTRQNLAYAYALAGRWKDARTIAGMDLAALDANERITQWAQTAAPGLAQQRIAAFMGVSVDGADMGQPVALALAPQQAPVQMAQADPVAASEATIVAAPVAPEQPAPSFAAVDIPAAPVTAKAAYLAAPVQVARAAIVPTPELHVPVRTVKLPLRREPAAARPRYQQAGFQPEEKGASNWVVQLGAYDNAAIAKEKWFDMARRNAALAAYPVVTSQISLNGNNFYRLAISGFGSRADADTLCKSIRQRSGQCFVRENAPDSMPQRWATAIRGRQFAGR